MVIQYTPSAYQIITLISLLSVGALPPFYSSIFWHSAILVIEMSNGVKGCVRETMTNKNTFDHAGYLSQLEVFNLVNKKIVNKPTLFSFKNL